MRKNSLRGITAMASLTLILLALPLIVGCAGEEKAPAYTPTPSSVLTPRMPSPTAILERATPTPDGTPARTATPAPTPAPEPLAAWWLSTWSEDGTALEISYTRGKGTLSENIHVSRGYDPFGTQVAGDEVRERKGEDIYGREQNLTIGIPMTWRGSGVKPDVVTAQGTISYPAGVATEQSWFARNLKVTVSYEYNKEGYLTGGSGNEEFSGHILEFSGHILTSGGKITYSGNASATFTTAYGQLLWMERVEKTNYYYDNKPYAETVVIVSPQAEYVGGKVMTVRETLKTTTTYADGSQRESEIVILWQRNEHGVTTGQNGSGVITGTEIMSGKPIDYTGSITIDYGFNSRIGWHKVGYNEKRSANTRLPKRLPFEVIFIDDPYFRPVF